MSHDRAIEEGRIALIADNNRSKIISLSLLLLISVVCFGYIHSLNKHLYQNLYYEYTDLVFFEQSLANFIHGHGLVNTGRGEQRSLFSEHTYFTHFLISLPIYYLFPQALTLFSLATIHVLVALAFVFFLAKSLLKNTALAWVCYFLFLSNTYMIISAGCFWQWGFHSEVYYLAYFLGFLYFWDKNKNIAILFFFLALLTKETYAIPLFLTALYFLIKKRGKSRTALVLAAVSLLYFGLATKWLIPLFGSGKTAYNYYAAVFDARRTPDFQMVPKMFFDYWKQMLIQFNFLPVFSPQILILGVPNSLLNILAKLLIDYNVPLWPDSWHSVPVYGFLIWAFLGSFHTLSKLIKKRILVYLFSVVLMSFSVSLFLDSRIPRLAHFRGNENFLKVLTRAKELTAGSDSLCVEWDLGAPFMQKRYLYKFPVNHQMAEYLLFRPTDGNLRRIKGIQYEIVFKTPRLILIRNLDFGASRPEKADSAPTAGN